MLPEMLFIQSTKNPAESAESPSKSFKSSGMDLSQRSLSGPNKITLFVLSLPNNFRVGFWCSKNPSIFLMFSFCVSVLCFRFMFSFYVFCFMFLFCVFLLCFRFVFSFYVFI